jgi:putative DNA primase/helicase
VLVVCQEGLELQLKAGRGLPPNVEITHFNAVSGLDRWKGVRGLIVIGRTMPAPADAEMIAETLAFRPVRRVGTEDGWYPKRTVGIRRRGSAHGTAVEAVYHPDPLVEAVRWQICEGQLLQVIGRGRAVNRTAADPLQIDLLTNVPLPIEVDEALSWDEAQPQPLALMAARGVLPGVGRDLAEFAARTCPDLFASPGRFQSWQETHDLKPGNAYESIPICDSGFEKWPAFRVRRAGARYAQAVQIDPFHGDPRAHLEAMLGELDLFEPLPLGPAAPVPAPAHEIDPVMAWLTGTRPAERPERLPETRPSLAARLFRPPIAPPPD